MKKSWIIILAIAVIIIGIISGIAISQKNKNEIEEKNIIENYGIDVGDEAYTGKNIYVENGDVVIENGNGGKTIETKKEANSSEEKISPNCLLILKRYYAECEHTINEYISIPLSLVNKGQKDLEEEYKNWNIEKYSSTEIILYREFESTCGQHFVLRNDEGKITVYLIDENNEETVYLNTEIAVDYLTETDKIQIQKGIRVNGTEELNQLIEDFE